LLNEESRRAILESLNCEGRVLVTELANRFETSQVTIRKDLEVLHEQRQVHRTYGGALPAREGALVHYGLRAPNLFESKVNRVMVEVAKRTVAVAKSDLKI